MKIRPAWYSVRITLNIWLKFRTLCLTARLTKFTPDSSNCKERSKCLRSEIKKFFKSAHCQGFRYETSKAYPLNPNSIIIYKTYVLKLRSTAVQQADQRKSKDLQQANNISINQSIKIYIAPLQDTNSEALPTQAKRKRTLLRRWWNWEQAPFGRCLN